MSVCLNTNADALSRVHSSTITAATKLSFEAIKADLCAAQQADHITKQIADALKKSPVKPTGRQWRHPPLFIFSPVVESTKYRRWCCLS